MTYHGDCTGPIGARLYHSTCPHTWVSTFTGAELTCACSCHHESEASD